MAIEAVFNKDRADLGFEKGDVLVRIEGAKEAEEAHGGKGNEGRGEHGL
jgi:hypothetical protein